MRKIIRYVLGLIIILTPLGLMAKKNSVNDDVAILYSKKFLLHNTGQGHPENPERLIKVVSQIKNSNTLGPSLIWPNINEASVEELALVHTQEYIDLVKKEVNLLKGIQISYLSTGDTVISKESNDVARLAVGAGLRGVDEIMSGRVSSAFVLNRPPGHHATASKGMGFCIYNNVAIAARYLQHKYNLKRILIVDFDVHHGNGTQDIFYEDDSVFYFSIHQHPFYPQSGRPSEIGFGKGKGFTMNVDLPKGSGDSALIKALSNKLIPSMKKFEPEFILISAGFDAHNGDLLGQLNYTQIGYKRAAIILKNIAREYSLGRTMYMLEGGYVDENISKSVNEILKVMIKKTH